MTRSSDVNRTTNHIVIQHLEHFEFYFIWLQTLTTHGLGPKSKEVKIRTLEKGQSYKIECFMSFLYSGHLTLVVSVQLLVICLKSHKCHRTPTGQPNFKSYTLGAEYPTNTLLLIQSMSSRVEAIFARFFHVLTICSFGLSVSWLPTQTLFQLVMQSGGKGICATNKKNVGNAHLLMNRSARKYFIRFIINS